MGAFYIWKKLSKKPVMEGVAGSEPARDDEYASRLEDELRKRK
jgi:hypothetical protein